MVPNLTELATQQLRDYDRRNPGTIFADGFSVDVPGAYGIQTEVCRLREQRGERLIGYKVGCTSPTIQRQLNITHPVFGRLFERDSWESEKAFSSRQFSNPAIEGEFAVRLGEDLGVDSTDEELLGSIDSVFAVIEMHNFVFRRGDPSAAELIANNAVHAGFVFPTELAHSLPGDADSLSIKINDLPVATVPGEQLASTVTQSLQWLSRELESRGLALRAGQTVLCGSVAAVFPVAAGDRIAALAGRFGSVRCTIA